jgi:hypothetical protein
VKQLELLTTRFAAGGEAIGLHGFREFVAFAGVGLHGDDQAYGHAVPPSSVAAATAED